MRYIETRRMVFFIARNPTIIIGAWYSSDYYNVIVSVIVLGVEVGFEYVRPHSDLSIRKRSSGWAWRWHP